ncbi:GNAT family N-acetyltransferase [Chelatococcus albus]|nr:GNAT family N-acetyltransferase [Chelatococcus sp. SYSU_G07232]
MATSALASSYARRLPHAALLLADDSPLCLAGRSRMVGEVAGKVVGFADYRPWDGHIKYLFVHPRAQARGVGAALVDAVQNAVGGRVGVHVLAVNDSALLWYLRRSFRIVDGWEEPFADVPAVWIRLVRERLPDERP